MPKIILLDFDGHPGSYDEDQEDPEHFDYHSDFIEEVVFHKGRIYNRGFDLYDGKYLMCLHNNIRKFRYFPKGKQLILGDEEYWLTGWVHHTMNDDKPDVISVVAFRRSSEELVKLDLSRPVKEIVEYQSREPFPWEIPRELQPQTRLEALTYDI